VIGRGRTAPPPVLSPSSILPPPSSQCAFSTYLLNPRSRALLQKLTGSQLVNKFPVFYVTRNFITGFTKARHLSLTWARSILSIPPYPTSWRSTLILSTHLSLGLPNGLFSSGPPPPNEKFGTRFKMLFHLFSCLKPGKHETAKAGECLYLGMNDSFIARHTTNARTTFWTTFWSKNIYSCWRWGVCVVRPRSLAITGVSGEP
jgi:hypothetical protein